MELACEVRKPMPRKAQARNRQIFNAHQLESLSAPAAAAAV